MYSREGIDKIKSHIKTHAYAKNNIEPTFYLFSTLFLVFGLLFLIHRSKKYNVVLIILLALVFLRLFMIFHDMCHRSYYPTNERKDNKKGFNFEMAHLLEPFALFSPEYWNKIHSTHHSTMGNIDEYDGTRTVLISSEYNKLPDYQKVLYTILRFPPIFFLVAPIYIFWISRVLNGEWEFIAKYILLLLVLFRIGSWKLMLSFVAAQYIGSTIGLIIFHLQHQVNDGHWKSFNNKDPVARANADLQGSTVLTIPWFLEYFTNGIEYHNVHHIDPGVPSYNMKRTYYELVNKGWLKDEKVGYLKGWQSLWNTIYNEETGLYE